MSNKDTESHSDESIDAIVKEPEPLFPPMFRMTSRAALMRQSSAALLRTHAAPSLLRKFSGTLFTDDEEEEEKIILYYVTGWDSVNLHYRFHGDEEWTKPPGVTMKKVIGVPQVLRSMVKIEEKLFHLQISDGRGIEFLPNFKGQKWDKAPGNQHYHINTTGRFLLSHGVVQEVMDPPGRPAVLRCRETGSTWVSIEWNPPTLNPQLVCGYIVYRNGEEIARLGEDHVEYQDAGLMGNCFYKYVVKTFNQLGSLSGPSDEAQSQTGEPGRPTSVKDLRTTFHCRTRIDLYWTRPDCHGGAPIAVYIIYRNGIPWAIQAADEGEGASWSDTKVEADTEYFYCVAASHCDSGLGKPMEPLIISYGDEEDKDILIHKLIASCKGYQSDVEGRITDGIFVISSQMLEVPRLHDRKTHIILQAFNWNSAKGSDLWNVLQKKTDSIERFGFTMVWLPPPSESVAPQGYMPSRLYNMDSAYGTAGELKALNKGLVSRGITPMLDLVVNHRCGSKQDERGEWTIYEDPDWDSSMIVSNNMQGYEGKGAKDSGAQSECAPDIDHTNHKVREDIKEWMRWLVKNFQFGTIRLDMAPGYSVRYQVEYIDAVGAPFAVGEYWSGDVQVLNNYVSSCSGRLAAFDFSIYYILRRCVECGNFEELNYCGKPPGLIGREPERAVTFIDNHDTEHLDFVGRFAGGNKEAVLRGYCYIMTHPGTPCVFWTHWTLYGSQMQVSLEKMADARKAAGIHSTSGIYVAEARYGLYAVYVNRDRWCQRGAGNLAMKLGHEHWHPEGHNWRHFCGGAGYDIWIRN
eukprot:GHVP01025002.1.p1 GENE.GHVP01025002.1~~GHVP01025002.1.p1  ORF type:complete len:802 (+),score=103.50 GHVP01025002.1:1440-3845(+)